MPDVATLARRALLLFLVGALVGPLCDQIHVVGHVLHYPDPDVAGLFSWWVPLQYGAAGVLFTLPCTPLVARFGLVETRADVRDVERSGVWFVAAYLASAVFASFPLALLLGFLLTFAWRVRVDGGLPVVLHALSVTVGGVTWEILLSSHQLFVYDVPRGLITVPLWLPGLYLHAALFTRQVARLFVAAQNAQPAPMEASSPSLTSLAK